VRRFAQKTAAFSTRRTAQHLLCRRPHDAAQTADGG
jgi:hypothetical protein